MAVEKGSHYRLSAAGAILGQSFIGPDLFSAAGEADCAADDGEGAARDRGSGGVKTGRLCVALRLTCGVGSGGTSLLVGRRSE
jgi:hypothetical protein